MTWHELGEDAGGKWQGCCGLLEWYDERGADIRKPGGARVEAGASLSLSTTPVSAKAQG